MNTIPKIVNKHDINFLLTKIRPKGNDLWFDFRKRCKWSKEHDTLLLREVLASEIWLTKPGSSERGEGWKKLLEVLNRVERPKFDVSPDQLENIFKHCMSTEKLRTEMENVPAEQHLMN